MKKSPCLLFSLPLLALGSLVLFAAGCSKAPSSAPPKDSGVTKPAAVTEWKSGYRVFVTNETSGDLTVIDGSTLEAIATVPLGKRPRGIHASPDGQTIYVALSGSPLAPPGVDESTLPPPDKSADGIGVFDVKQNKIVRVLPGGSDPENFDISRDGSVLYVSNEDAAGISFVEIATGKILETVRTGGEPEGVTLAPNGKQVFSTAEADSIVAVIDADSHKLLKKLKVGRRPRNIVFLPDGSRAYVNAENDGSVVVFDPIKYQTIQTIQLGTPGEVKPMGLALSPDAKHLYVSTGRGHKVFVIDLATNQSTASFEVGQRPWGIAVSPDGKTLFTANGPSNDISVVDLASQTVTKKIKATGSPWGVLILSR